MKKYEVVIAYCSDYHIETFEIEAADEEQAREKSEQIELKHFCEAILWEDVTEMKGGEK